MDSFLSSLWLTGSHHNPAGSFPNSSRISLCYRLMHICGFKQYQCLSISTSLCCESQTMVLYSHTTMTCYFCDALLVIDSNGQVMDKSSDECYYNYEELPGSFASQYFIMMCIWPYMASHILYRTKPEEMAWGFPYGLDHMALEQM